MTQELATPRAMTPEAARDTARRQAVAAAEAAAERAGLTIVELDTVERIQHATELFNEVWSVTREEPLIPANTLRALQHSGNYVFGAYEGDRLTGAIVGFHGRHDGSPQLHSHILGVSPQSQGRSVGFALKQHQRAWTLAHDIDVVTWTFDPLVRRNAYFNVAKLGATISAYFANFYGAMNDGINDGDESDRVLVEWPLRDPGVEAASEGRPSDLDLRRLQDDGAAIVLHTNGDGTPVTNDRRDRVLLASIPEDIVALRASDRDLANSWRAALRDVLGGALQDGYAAVGMSRTGWYVLRTDN
jgi:predicted GNAT superfamily acetyltransferase